MPLRQNHAQSSRLVNTSSDDSAASLQQPAAAQRRPVISVPAVPDDPTATAEHALLHGNGLARAVLSDPGIEGDPLAFLKATEAYWKVGASHSARAAHAGRTALLCTSRTRNDCRDTGSASLQSAATPPGVLAMNAVHSDVQFSLLVAPVPLQQVEHSWGQCSAVHATARGGWDLLVHV